MAEDYVIRPEEHETDTAARRIVPSLLPSSWEHRESGGRDYGVDMNIEMFKGGRATGNTLLLQIKGTTKAIDGGATLISFDLPVSTLKYSELFAVPFLLVLCPVNDDPKCWYYLWLQEYIEVVLNFEAPNWRANKTTARVKIPSENRMPGRQADLESIADEPARIKSWGRLAHIIHELNWMLTDLDIETDQRPSRKVDFKRAKSLLNELKQLRGLDTHSNYGLMQVGAIEPLEQVLGLLKRRKPITQGDLQGVFSFNNEGLREYEKDHDPESIMWLMKTLAIHRIEAAMSSLPASLSQYFDVRLRNTLWRHSGLHRF
jgi:hypothetical protein